VEKKWIPRAKEVENPPSIEGRVPPHDLDAEAAVLSAAMLDPSALDKVVELKPEHFYSEAHRRIYEACLELRQTGSPVDVVQVGSYLKDRQRLAQVGGMPYLGQILDSAPVVANIGAYGRVIHEKFRIRQLILACQRVSAQGYGDYGEPQAFIDNAEQAIYNIARTSSKQSVEKLIEVMKKAFAKLNDAVARGDRITGVSTGFDRYDKQTAGLHEGDLTIIAARPGMGKTSFVLNLASNVAKPRHNELTNDSSQRWDEPGVGVAVFSLEMPREQLANRLVCAEARVDVSKMRTGFLGPSDWNKLTMAASALGSLPIWIDDSPGLSLLDLRSKVRRIQAEYDQRDDAGKKVRKLGCVIVDYLQLMKGRDGVNSREQEISEISRGLKGLAKELELPVIALSQLNRAVETRSDKSKRPMISDLRECVTGDTLVLLADGRRLPIASLVGTAPQVVAMSEAQKLVIAQAECVFSKGEKAILEVRLASGRKVRVTPQHRLYGANGWVRAGELAMGDRLAIARRLPEPDHAEEWSESKLALLGHLVGDGSYLVHQPLRYTTACEESSALVATAACELGSTVKRYEGRGNWHQLVIAGNGNRWHPAGVNRWLRELGIYGQRSHEKHLPEAVFRLSNACIAVLLRHLWATDGCIFARKEGQKGSSSVYFATCSERLAADVAALLLRLGIVARSRLVVQRKGRPVYNVIVSGAEQQRRFLETVGTFGPRRRPGEELQRVLAVKAANTNVDTLPVEVFEQVRASMAASGISQREMTTARGTSHGGSSHFRFAPSRTTLASYAEILDDDDLRQRASSDLFWDVVVSIEPAGLEEVFDLTVPGPTSWIAESSIVSHNSGAIEQDADNIVFIYRDDYYHQDSPEQNIAELIIAKQRNGPTGTVKVRFDKQWTRFDNLADGEYEDGPE
jgi:replicative DNA helicase